MSDFLTEFIEKNQPKKREPRTEEQKWEAVELCGCKYCTVDASRGGMRYGHFYCKDRERCSNCRKRYIDNAIEDLCVAYNYFGGLWVYDEPLHPDERDKVYQRIYRALYNDRYLRIDVAEDSMKIIIASDTKPKFGGMDNWTSIDPRNLTEDEEPMYSIPCKNGSKSGALVNYIKKNENRKSEPSFTIPEAVIIVNKAPSKLTLNLKAAYAQAAKRTEKANRTANVSPDYRKHAVLDRIRALREVMTEWGYEYTVLWRKQRVRMSAMANEFK